MFGTFLQEKAISHKYLRSTYKSSALHIKKRWSEAEGREGQEGRARTSAPIARPLLMMTAADWFIELITEQLVIRPINGIPSKLPRTGRDWHGLARQRVTLTVNNTATRPSRRHSGFNRVRIHSSTAVIVLRVVQWLLKERSVLKLYATAVLACPTDRK